MSFIKRAKTIKTKREELFSINDEKKTTMLTTIIITMINNNNN